MTKEEKIKAVRKLVDKLAKSRVTSFFPDYIVKQIPGLTYREAVEYLKDLTKWESLLEMKWQIICPNERCGSKNRVYNNLKNIPKNIECPYCGYEIQNAAEFAMMIFVFNQEYKAIRCRCNVINEIRGW